MISPNLVKMKDDGLINTVIQNNDNIISQLVGHHYATILNGVSITFQYNKRCHGRALASKLHDSVLKWFCNEISDMNLNLFGKSIINIYSEYKRDSIQYCAHPNFCKRGPWHDWVMVMYEPFDNDDDTTSTTTELPFDINENPSKIMCFL